MTNITADGSIYGEERWWYKAVQYVNFMDVVYNFPKHAALSDSPAVTNQCLECAEKDLDIASLRQQVKDLQKELHQINSKLI